MKAFECVFVSPSLLSSVPFVMCFIPHYSGRDSEKFAQGSETPRTKAQQRCAACIKRNEKSMSENDPPYLRLPLFCEFCLLPFEYVEYTH